MELVIAKMDALEITASLVLAVATPTLVKTVEPV